MSSQNYAYCASLKLYVTLFCLVFIGLGVIQIYPLLPLLRQILVGEIDLAGGQIDSIEAIRLICSMGFIGIATYYMILENLRLSKYQRRTYQWYRSSYPETQKNLTCYSCGDARIITRPAASAISRHTEHFCPQCGATLFFSLGE